MVKDFFLGLLFLIIAVLLQVFWSFSLGIKDVKPDFVLVAIVFICFQKSPVFGLLTGFLGGVLTYGATGFGAAGLIISRLLVGYFTGSMTKSFSANSSSFMIVISVLWLTPFSGVIMMIANPRPLLSGMETILYSTILNMLLTIVFIGIRFLFFKDRKNYYLD